MKKSNSIFLSVIIVAIFSCTKESFIPVGRIMKFRVDAFYTDTSLFQSISINDTLLASSAVMNPGSITTLVDISAGIPREDSVRLKILIVKQKNPNVQLDTTIYLTNVNDFLLLQLDPTKKPILINKRIENATAVPPGRDSVKARFYFNTDDNILNPKNSNSKVTVLNMQLYTGETDAFGKFIIKPERLITGIRAGQLSEYLSFTTKKFYAATFIDASPGVSSNRREIQIYKHDQTAFVKGSLSFAGITDGKFQTLRIRTSTITDVNGDDQKGYNGLFLFGLN